MLSKLSPCKHNGAGSKVSNWQNHLNNTGAPMEECKAIQKAAESVGPVCRCWFLRFEKTDTKGNGAFWIWFEELTSGNENNDNDKKTSQSAVKTVALKADGRVVKNSDKFAYVVMVWIGCVLDLAKHGLFNKRVMKRTAFLYRIHVWMDKFYHIEIVSRETNRAAIDVIKSLLPPKGMMSALDIIYKHDEHRKIFNQYLQNHFVFIPPPLRRQRRPCMGTPESPCESSDENDS